MVNEETGTNEAGDDYSIIGVGRNIAAQIAYSNLTVYLTPTSGYNESSYYSIK